MTVHYVDEFMCIAFEEAKIALKEGEVPVGCVLVSLSSNEEYYNSLTREQETCSKDEKELEEEELNTSPMSEGNIINCDSYNENNTTSIKLCIEKAKRFILARGRNATNKLHHALAHAEYMAIDNLIHTWTEQKMSTKEESLRECKVLYDTKSYKIESSYRYEFQQSTLSLSEYVLYVTVEPCIMCAAMLLYNQINTVFYGCANDRFGGTGSILSLHDAEQSHLYWNNNNGCSHNTDNRNSNQICNNGSCSVNSSNKEKECAVRLIGYRCEGGHRASEAVALLQLFYKRENPNAPGHKRRRKPESTFDYLVI